MDTDQEQKLFRDIRNLPSWPLIKTMLRTRIDGYFASLKVPVYTQGDHVTVLLAISNVQGHLEELETLLLTIEESIHYISESKEEGKT